MTDTTVKMNGETFIDLLRDRVLEVYAARNYPNSFWEGVWDYYRDTGFPTDSDGCVLAPSVIVDNIAVNGEIKTFEELHSEGYLDEDTTKDELLESGWLKIGNYYVINWGI